MSRLSRESRDGPDPGFLQPGSDVGPVAQGLQEVWGNGRAATSIHFSPQPELFSTVVVPQITQRTSRKVLTLMLTVAKYSSPLLSSTFDTLSVIVTEIRQRFSRKVLMSSRRLEECRVPGQRRAAGDRQRG